MSTKQTNIVANPARHLVFFEGEELAYNYATGQWSRIPAYDGYGMYSVNDPDQDIGLIVYSSGSVDLQEQATSDVAQTASIATGAYNLNEFGRAVVNGVRPLYRGTEATATVYVGSQAKISDSADWSSGMSVNTRTGMANFRKEGRYHRAQVELSGGFDVLMGIDVEFSPQGTV